MEGRKDYREVVNWSNEDINSRLGELALNRATMTPRQIEASELELDCLIFEMHCREEIDGRTDLPASS